MDESKGWRRFEVGFRNGTKVRIRVPDEPFFVKTLQEGISKMNSSNGLYAWLGDSIVIHVNEVLYAVPLSAICD